MKKLLIILKKIIPYFLMIEGIDHFIISTIAVIGLVHHHIGDFWAWFTPICDYVLGVGTFLGGLIFHRKNK